MGTCTHYLLLLHCEWMRQLPRLPHGDGLDLRFGARTSSLQVVFVMARVTRAVQDSREGAVVLMEVGAGGAVQVVGVGGLGGGDGSGCGH